MSNSSFATYPQVSSSSYGQNLAHAARAFIAALFAVKPSKSEVAVAKPAMDGRTRAASIAKLYRLASRYESMSPSLATELRQIAGRD
ncbi:hypothetical protein [Noviherbaspirillum massiliense]|uniref:hypothetical protein n=1 Tax=Noviherbaspirillum massiliense TaxID=1465823 RepID=UPI0002F7E8DB|nr:hypothetical protein [Noviherbaspirillum massiliense]